MDWIEIVKITAEVLLVAFALYKFYSGVRQTKAIAIIKVLVIGLFTVSACAVLGLTAIVTIAKYLLAPVCLLLFVVYQPELRRAFAMEKRGGLFFRKGSQTSGEQIDSVLSACKVLAAERRGALIVFPRQISAKAIIDTGTHLNADLTTQLILTVFDHDTPLHDGAMFIDGGKIIASGCYLPLSDQRDIKKTFGTRHRAALGMAEETDAVVLVVSEEKGTMSLAYNSDLYYDLDSDTIKRTLLTLLNYQTDNPVEIGGSGNEN